MENEKYDESVYEFGENTTIHLLHRDIYSSDLFSGDCLFVFDRLLTPKERQIVQMKVDEASTSEILLLLGMQESTLKRHIYNLKMKYRTKAHTRVDNDLRLRAKKGFKSHRRKT